MSFLEGICAVVQHEKISELHTDLAEGKLITVVLTECFILIDMPSLLVLSQEIKGAKLQKNTIGSISVGINKNANTDVCRFLSKGILKKKGKTD